jgi:hypothetical protein
VPVSESAEVLEHQVQLPALAVARAVPAVVARHATAQQQPLHMGHDIIIIIIIIIIFIITTIIIIIISSPTSSSS